MCDKTGRVKDGKRGRASGGKRGKGWEWGGLSVGKWGRIKGYG